MNLTAFNSTEDFFKAIKGDPDNNFCFGFEMSNIYPGVKEVNFTLLMPRDVASNTMDPLYDLTQSSPSWRSWNTTFVHGTPQLMVYLTDFLVLLLKGTRIYDIELAFTPMKTP